MKVTTTGNWKSYWGSMPMPVGAEALGLVTRDNGQTGALIRLANGNYVQGNAGSIRTLPQREIEERLAASAAGAALGSVRSPRKASTSAENGKRGGRPSLEDRAEQRVSGSEELSKYRDEILYDWPEGNEHWRWVINATIAEIVDWAKCIRAGGG